MSAKHHYRILYAPITRDHLRAIDKKYYSLIRDTIEERLANEPTTENRNRKPLKRTAFEEATWELRFGPDNMFRVFYDVDTTDYRVHILAIGRKERDTLYVGAEEIQI